MSTLSTTHPPGYATGEVEKGRVSGRDANTHTHAHTHTLTYTCPTVWIKGKTTGRPPYQMKLAMEKR